MTTLLALNQAGLYFPKETVYAMSTVYTDRRLNFSLQVNPDENHVGLPYFKFYNSAHYGSAEKLARISFEQPVYIKHNSNWGKKKEPWILNGKERRMLMDVLQRKVNIYAGVPTVWQSLIVAYNMEKGFMPENTLMCTCDNIGDVLESYNDPALIGIMPFDLPIPDYTKLKE